MKARVGLVGLFGIANAHIREIKASPELELGAVCDIDEALGTKWSQEYGVPWYRDYHDLVRAKDVDFIILGIPHYLHAEVAIAAMEAGMPVIIQKPMCVTVSEADRIIETARRTGTKVATYHTAHLSEWDAINTIREGKIGKLMRFNYNAHASRGIAYYNSGPWRGKWAGEGSGVLSNQCIHDINRMQALMGPVAEITSATLANIGHPGMEVEDAAVAGLRFENGAFGVFQVTLYTQPAVNNYDIIGNLGCILKQGSETKFGIFDKPLWDYLLSTDAVRKPGATLEDAARPQVTWQPLPEYDKLDSQTLMFARAVMEDKEPYAPPEFALRDIEVWNGIILSHFRHKPVKLPLDRAEYDDLFEEMKAGQHDLHWSQQEEASVAPLLSGAHIS